MMSWVSLILGPREAALWWRLPNPAFGWKTPHTYAMSGDIDHLYTALQRALIDWSTGQGVSNVLRRTP